MLLWRYLLFHYLRMLALCLVTFMAVLLTLRLDEIAHFITLGPESAILLWFTVYQIPYILPIALPISALVSAILLMQDLSVSHELTALRSCGISLRTVLAPILLVAAFLSIANFLIVSEVATSSHLATGLLKTELRSLNPLLLLHNKHLMHMKGIYFDTIGPSRLGESAADVVIAAPNKDNNRLNILIAHQLSATASDFITKDLTWISHIPSKNAQQSDTLFMENIGAGLTTLQDFRQMVEHKVWSLNNDHLRLPLLLARIQEDSRAYSEIARRISLGLAVFTFTLMGATFAITISRTKSSRGLIIAIGLASLYLIAYFAGKSSEHRLITSSLLYLSPHAVIIGLSLWKLRRIARGSSFS